MGNYQKFNVAQFENVEKIEVEKPKGFLAKFQEKSQLALAVILGAGAVTAQSAHANDAVTQIGNAFTSGLSGVSAPVVALFVAAAAVLMLFVAWKYLKRGANSA